MSDSKTSIDVDFLFLLSATTGDRSNALIKDGPQGTRVVVPVIGGQFDGPRLRGTVVPPGGDWVTVRENRVSRLDVRLQLVTDDGEAILMTYTGILARDEDGSTCIRTAPLFETGAEKYRWLNDVQAVGLGTTQGDQVTYQVYALR